MNEQLKKVVDIFNEMIGKLKRDHVSTGKDHPIVTSGTTQTSTTERLSFSGTNRPVVGGRPFNDEASKKSSLAELRRQHAEAKRKAYGV